MATQEDFPPAPDRKHVISTATFNALKEKVLYALARSGFSDVPTFHLNRFLAAASGQDFVGVDKKESINYLTTHQDFFKRARRHASFHSPSRISGGKSPGRSPGGGVKVLGPEDIDSAYLETVHRMLLSGTGAGDSGGKEPSVDQLRWFLRAAGEAPCGNKAQLLAAATR